MKWRRGIRLNHDSETSGARFRDTGLGLRESRFSERITRCIARKPKDVFRKQQLHFNLLMSPKQQQNLLSMRDVCPLVVACCIIFCPSV
jgi:hypothetical protein